MNHSQDATHAQYQQESRLWVDFSRAAHFQQQEQLNPFLFDIGRWYPNSEHIHASDEYILSFILVRSIAEHNRVNSQQEQQLSKINGANVEAGASCYLKSPVCIYNNQVSSGWWVGLSSTSQQLMDNLGGWLSLWLASWGSMYLGSTLIQWVKEVLCQNKCRNLLFFTGSIVFGSLNFKI